MDACAYYAIIESPVLGYILRIALTVITDNVECVWCVVVLTKENGLANESIIANRTTRERLNECIKKH